MFEEGKGRESFSESYLVTNADVSVRKRLPTLCLGERQIRNYPAEQPDASAWRLILSAAGWR